MAIMRTVLLIALALGKNLAIAESSTCRTRADGQMVCTSDSGGRTTFRERADKTVERTSDSGSKTTIRKKADGSWEVRE